MLAKLPAQALDAAKCMCRVGVDGSCAVADNGGVETGSRTTRVLASGDEPLAQWKRADNDRLGLLETLGRVETVHSAKPLAPVLNESAWPLSVTAVGGKGSGCNERQDYKRNDATPR